MGLAGLSAGSGWLGGRPGHLGVAASSLAFNRGVRRLIVLMMRRPGCCWRSRDARGPPPRLRSLICREGEPPLMSPLGVVVSIVLVDLLGFTVVMPLLAPFAKQYGFSRLADRRSCSPPTRCASSSPGRSWAG